MLPLTSMSGWALTLVKPTRWSAVLLPCPTAPVRTIRVLALVTPDKEEEARAAGADYVGLDELY